MNGQLLNVNELRAKRAIIVTIKSGAVTAAGNTQSTPVRVSQFKEANFFLDVTAIAGTTKQFTATVYTKDPISGKWFSLVAFTQATDVTSEMKTVAANLGAFLAATWAIGGTGSPTFTFSIGAVLKAD